jgi:hypothetical protein
MEIIVAPDSTPAADPAAEIGADLHRTLARYTDWAVKAYRDTLDHIERKQAGYVPPGERDNLATLRENLRLAIEALDRVGKEPSSFLEDRTAVDVSWYDITDEMTRDRDAGLALWGKVKQAATNELAVGKRGAETVEPYHHSPWQRAQYLAIRAALADGLHPRNGMEHLLIDGMAQAWTMHLHWLGKHAKTESLDAYRVEQDARRRGEWQPPRLSDVEAVDRAALMADRFLRQFLRLMKTYRDGRKLFASVTMRGGQLNIAGDGGQQVVATRTIPTASSPRIPRAARPRRRIRRKGEQRDQAAR